MTGKPKSASDPALLRIEYVTLDQVKLWDKNPKKHDLKGIIESIYRYGFQDPPKFDEALGGLVYGNGRTEALIVARDQKREPPRGVMLNKKTGAWCVPVMFGNDLASANAASAFAIDYNNLTMAGSHTPEEMARMWSAEGYQSLMQSLKSVNEMPITTWMPKEDKPDPGAQMDKADELLKKWKVKTGDLREIGEHRLLCGDSTKREDVERVMGGEKAGAVMTDPPYGINREGIENDDPEGLQELFDGCLSVMPIENAVVIAFQSPRLFPVWLDAVRKAGHKFERMLWMYKRNDVTNVWRGWLLTSEAILLSSFGKAEWEKDKDAAHDCYMLNWEEKTFGKIDGWHASIKPLEVVQNIITHTTGDVYEPFAGSGTTLVACERLNRKCRAIEIVPKYVAVALERLAGMGLEPRRVK